MADVAKGEIAPLMDVARGDQPQVDRAEHLDQVAACRLWHIADCCRLALGIVGRGQVERLVQE